MRIFYVVLIWVLLVGGVALYMDARATAAPLQEFIREEAQGRFILEITPTFSAEPDPFGLDLDGSGKTALLLQLDGKEILKRSDTLTAGEVIRLDPVPGLKIGVNEFFLEANPPSELSSRSHAVRVRILKVYREGDPPEPVGEYSVWSDPDMSVTTTFELKIKIEDDSKGNQKDPHGHEH